MQNNDLTAARSAMEAYNAEWNGIEVYVNFRSRDLYSEIESHYEADVDSALKAPDADRAQVLALVQAMIGKYDEAIRLSDTGEPLSPMFDDLAIMRTARAPLRTVSPALQAGDTAKASGGICGLPVAVADGAALVAPSMRPMCWTRRPPRSIKPPRRWPRRVATPRKLSIRCSPVTTMGSTW